MTLITLGILDCDELAPELQPDYQNYGEMFKALLGFAQPDLSFRVYSVLAGELPNRVDECDGYLLSGSKTGVYDSDNWLEDLADFVKKVYESKRPLAGICFGHQFLCHHLGGRADKSEKGWGIGVLTHEQQASPAWMAPMPTRLNLLYSHQDQVQVLPEQAERLYGSDFCPNGACWQPGRLLTFQGHPEFTKDYSRRLMTLRQSRYADGQYEQAIGSLDLETNEAYVAQSLVKFFKGEDV